MEGCCMYKYKFSVILPVFNVAEFLNKSLESLQKQTLRDIEIICVNDCSTDDSLSILEDFATQDNRIKIINFYLFLKKFGDFQERGQKEVDKYGYL